MVTTDEVITAILGQCNLLYIFFAMIFICFLAIFGQSLHSQKPEYWNDPPLIISDTVFGN